MAGRREHVPHVPLAQLVPLVQVEDAVLGVVEAAVDVHPLDPGLEGGRLLPSLRRVDLRLAAQAREVREVALGDEPAT